MTSENATSATEPDRRGRVITNYKDDLVPLLRPLREVSGRSGAEVARGLHCTPSLVTQREKGKRGLSFADGLATLAALGVRVRLEAADGAPCGIRELLETPAASPSE